MAFKPSRKKIKKVSVSVFDVIKHAINQFSDENALSLAGGIAYYAVFSFPGILIIIAKVAGIIYEKEEVKEKMLGYIEEIIGVHASDLVEQAMGAVSTSSLSPIAWTIGISVLVFSATTVFVAVQNSLDTIWNVRLDPKGWRAYVQILIDRFFSFLLILIFGAIFVAFILAETLLQVFHDFLESHIPFSIFKLIQVVNASLPLLVLTVVLAVTFKVLPNVRLKWKDVWIGSFITAILLTIGKVLISFYLSKSSIADAYGAAGSVVIILVWIYYSSAIYLFGAQIIESILVNKGRQVIPSNHAIKYERKEIHGERF